MFRSRYNKYPGIDATVVKYDSAVLVQPSDDLLAKYAWLKSADRDGIMGVRSHTNRRLLLLTPGRHALFGTLMLDTPFVDIAALVSGDPSATLVYGAISGATAIKQTSVDIRLSGFSIKTPDGGSYNPYVGAGLEINIPQTTGITITNVFANYWMLRKVGTDWTSGLQNDEEMFITGTGQTAGWYPINAQYTDTVQGMYGNDCLVVVAASGLAGNSGTNDAIADIGSQHNQYSWMRFLDPDSGAGRSVCGTSPIHGVWRHCDAQLSAWRVADDKHVRGEFWHCTAGDHSFGGDGEAGGTSGLPTLSGSFYFCRAGESSFCGCGAFAGDCDVDSYFYECRAGDNSFGMRNEFAGTAIRCEAGQNSFAGCLAGGVGETSIKFTGYAENCSTEGGRSFGIGNGDESNGTVINCRNGSVTDWAAGTLSVDTVGADWTGTAIGSHPLVPTAYTSNKSIRTIENSHTFTTAGASGTVTLSLPPAQVGLKYHFRVVAAQELRIDPNGTDTIAINGTQQAAGKYIVADGAGELCTLECVTAGQWEQTNALGTWTAES